MSEALSDRFLNELVDDLEHKRLVLPTLPEVALRVREVVDDEDASLADVARVVATDAALSARLIQVANSPLMRASREITSLDAAVGRLGMKMVRDMVTSIVMRQMFQATSEVTDRKLRHVWEHSVQVAAIAHAMASQFTRLDSKQAMLAGLVHDIGALPILTKAEDYPALLEDEAALDAVLSELHARLGAEILKAWNFPDELVAVAAEHESLERNSEHTDYVDVVIVANLQSYLGTQHRLTKVNWGRIPAFSKLGLSPDVNVIELDEAAGEIQETQRMLAG